jgi:Na+-driven multidrug efflux pump
MKKFRIRNWLILIILITIYGILKYFELDGFWSGFSFGAAAGIFIGELFWLIKKRDMND